MRARARAGGRSFVWFVWFMSKHGGIGRCRSGLGLGHGKTRGGWPLRARARAGGRSFVWFMSKRGGIGRCLPGLGLGHGQAALRGAVDWKARGTGPLRARARACADRRSPDPPRASLARNVPAPGRDAALPGVCGVPGGRFVCAGLRLDSADTPGDGDTARDTGREGTPPARAPSLPLAHRAPHRSSGVPTCSRGGWRAPFRRWPGGTRKWPMPPCERCLALEMCASRPGGVARACSLSSWRAARCAR